VEAGDLALVPRVLDAGRATRALDAAGRLAELARALADVDAGRFAAGERLRAAEARFGVTLPDRLLGDMAGVLRGGAMMPDARITNVDCLQTPHIIHMRVIF